MSDLTPGTLRREGLHSRECRRYIVGRANTSAADCTCWIGAYATAWAAERATSLVDRKRIKTLEKADRISMDNIIEKAARIEALEKWAEDAIAVIGLIRDHASDEATYDYARAEIVRLRAALPKDTGTDVRGEEER